MSSAGSKGFLLLLLNCALSIERSAVEFVLSACLLLSNAQYLLRLAQLVKTSVTLTYNPQDIPGGPKTYPTNFDSSQTFKIGVFSSELNESVTTRHVFSVFKLSICLLANVLFQYNQTSLQDNIKDVLEITGTLTMCVAPN